jgi:hypothetical protein
MNIAGGDSEKVSDTTAKMSDKMSNK